MGASQVRIDNKALREAVLASPFSLQEISDIAKVHQNSISRSLGIREQIAGNGRTYTQTKISEKTALRIIRALDLWPLDFGL